MFQLTAARRRLPRVDEVHPLRDQVSTHSRSKAAAKYAPSYTALWVFQLTAARRRLPRRQNRRRALLPVSTHSRSKAAAQSCGEHYHSTPVSTHSRSKAAAFMVLLPKSPSCCFNSQPLEGGCFFSGFPTAAFLGFNSQPLEGGCPSARTSTTSPTLFQLTAARRRLHRFSRS